MSAYMYVIAENKLNLFEVFEERFPIPARGAERFECCVLSVNCLGREVMIN